jgi:hypothetical protein
MTNKDNNKTKFNLTSIARWKAFCRKHNVLSKDEIEFVQGQPNYIRKWLLDGEGTPYAKVTNADIESALREAQIDVNSLDTLDISEAKLFLNYCYNAIE